MDRAFAGDGEREPVFAVFGIVDVDLGVLRGVAEEGERLVGTVAVHVAELHALAVAPWIGAAYSLPEASSSSMSDWS